MLTELWSKDSALKGCILIPSISWLCKLGHACQESIRAHTRVHAKTVLLLLCTTESAELSIPGKNTTLGKQTDVRGRRHIAENKTNTGTTRDSYLRLPVITLPLWPPCRGLSGQKLAFAQHWDSKQTSESGALTIILNCLAHPRGQILSLQFLRDNFSTEAADEIVKCL